MTATEIAYQAWREACDAAELAATTQQVAWLAYQQVANEQVRRQDAASRPHDSEPDVSPEMRDFRKALEKTLDAHWAGTEKDIAVTSAAVLMAARAWDADL